MVFSFASFLFYNRTICFAVCFSLSLLFPITHEKWCNFGMKFVFKQKKSFFLIENLYKSNKSSNFARS
jgi:hypothetical protein